MKHIGIRRIGRRVAVAGLASLFLLATLLTGLGAGAAGGFGSLSVAVELQDQDGKVIPTAEFAIRIDGQGDSFYHLASPGAPFTYSENITPGGYTLNAHYTPPGYEFVGFLREEDGASVSSLYIEVEADELTGVTAVYREVPLPFGDAFSASVRFQVESVELAPRPKSEPSNGLVSPVVEKEAGGGDPADPEGEENGEDPEDDLDDASSEPSESWESGFWAFESDPADDTDGSIEE